MNDFRPDPEFWRGRRVLVTGHSGFKGAWLSLWLQQMGAEVSGLSLAPPSDPNLFQLLRLDRTMPGSTSIDLRDQAAVAQHLKSASPEVVFHLAAQALVRRGYREPVETLATNVMGTAHLFEAVRRCDSVRAVVNVTSDKCYHNQEWAWGYRENDPLGGVDPYSASKAAAEIVTTAYRHSFFSLPDSSVALASARGGNVIGGGDWGEDRLLPDLVRAFSRGEKLLIRYPHAVRPWQHVLELLCGYLQLARALIERPELAADAWNFGPLEGDARPVGWLVGEAASLWGGEAQWQLESQPQPHEASLLKLDASRARALLGWQSRWRVEDAVAASIDWYRAWHDGQEMLDYSIGQLERYRCLLGQE
jgi:CDP-glucose 4,6-dehydratase